MFFEPTAIHDDKQAGFFCTKGYLFVNDPFLHPDSFDAASNRFFNDRKNIFRLPEDIHQIDCARYGSKCWIGRLAENIRLVRIHRDYPIGLPLHIGGHAIRRTCRIRR